MSNFTVSEIIDGDTFKVEGGWNWRNANGDIVRPTGYDTPEEGYPGFQAAKSKLTSLILGKIVQLGEVITIDRGRLVVDVFYNGKNLADYFPEYKK